MRPGPDAPRRAPTSSKVRGRHARMGFQTGLLRQTPRQPDESGADCRPAYEPGPRSPRRPSQRVRTVRQRPPRALQRHMPRARSRQHIRLPLRVARGYIQNRVVVFEGHDDAQERVVLAKVARPAARTMSRPLPPRLPAWCAASVRRCPTRSDSRSDRPATGTRFGDTAAPG